MQDNDLPQIGTPMQTDETRAREVLADTLPEGSMVQRLVLSGQSPDQEMFTIDDAIRAMLAFATPEPRTIDPRLDDLIRRNTVAKGYANTVAIAEEAFEMGVKSAAPPTVEREFKTLADQTGAPGRVVIGKDDPLYKAFRPRPETIAAIEKDERANAQGLAAIRDMMFGHVTNWPEPKRFGTAIALVDKTLHAALAPTLHPSDREEELREAAQAVVDNASRSYRSRGKDRYIEDESGELVMLVPHEDWYRLAHSLDAILALSGSLAPEGGAGMSKAWCEKMAHAEGDAEIGAGLVAMDPVLCLDCPPAGYPTDKTRCEDCPRALSPSTQDPR